MSRSVVRTAFVALSSILVAAACGDLVSPGEPGTPLDPVSVQTASLAEGIEGQAYSQQLEAEGGSGGYSWVLAAGSLPSGLTLSPAGSISGTPGAPAAASFRVRATDSEGQSATADLSLAVVQALAVHTWALPDAEAGETYTAPLQAVGGRGTLVWSVTGEAASWLTVSSAGVLSGTPAEPGSSAVTIGLSDESGQTATRQLTVTVRAPLAVAPISLPPAIEGRAYAAQLVATGGSGAYTWSLESGALPAGVALTAGGALTGKAASGGEFTFTAKVTDEAERVATRTLSLTVERAPTIQTAGLPPADIDVAYGAELVATGGTGAYVWTLIEGALPAGLTLSADGAITGTPTAPGSSTFTVRVTDEAGATHTRALAIVVASIDTLVDGVAVTITGAQGSRRYFAFDVPEGATGLTVSMSGGTGDADLYLRRGALPEEHAYDCRPLRTGNDETCAVTGPAAGTWYVMINGYADHADVSLLASHDG